MNIETLLLCLIVCMAGSVRSSRNQMFFAEKMLENKAVMSNLITKLHNISPTQCSYICLQQKCECFGFESNTKTCRIHAFCRLYSTSVDEAGWKYYRTEWATFMSSEYWLGLKEATWSDAAIDCLSKGAKLVEIESSAEDNFILTLAMELTRNVWLGGTDMTVEGKWVWQSTGTLFSYSAWDMARGQPNNYANQDCLSLYRPYGLTWCDESCGASYQYICEREIITTV
ncbi:perlucin-like protein [Crassostrea angulata]|uniref:perlucin-like protein n=1 Tax=Magallana angulata TaxID=2784310 RepID=UPI0022B0B9BB|nr:perlucin-like protein [Crassostrea angulata]